MNPQDYIQFLTNHSGPPPFVQGVCGRIIRGKDPKDFERLSDDPDRKVVMLTDSGGLAKFFGKSDYEKCVVVGHHPDHIKGKVNSGYSYKLVVFPEKAAVVADWTGVFQVAQQVYPDLSVAIRQYGPVLRGNGNPVFEGGRTKDFAAIEAKAGRKFMDCDDKNHPDFMSYDNWKKSNQDDAALRALFYHTFHLKELFSGNGYTYNEVGRKGVKEYLMLNCLISDIPGHIVHDMNVKLP